MRAYDAGPAPAGGGPDPALARRQREDALQQMFQLVRQNLQALAQSPALDGTQGPPAASRRSRSGGASRKRAPSNSSRRSAGSRAAREELPPQPAAPPRPASPPQPRRPHPSQPPVVTNVALNGRRARSPPKPHPDAEEPHVVVERVYYRYPDGTVEDAETFMAKFADVTPAAYGDEAMYVTMEDPHLHGIAAGHGPSDPLAHHWLPHTPVPAPHPMTATPHAPAPARQPRPAERSPTKPQPVARPRQPSPAPPRATAPAPPRPTTPTKHRPAPAAAAPRPTSPAPRHAPPPSPRSPRAGADPAPRPRGGSGSAEPAAPRRARSAAPRAAARAEEDLPDPVQDSTMAVHDTPEKRRPRPPAHLPAHDGPSVFDVLYARSVQRNAIRREIEAAADRIRKQQEVEAAKKECTFKPKINRLPNDPPDTATVVERLTCDFKRRQRLLQDAHEKAAEKELKDCTFKPQIETLPDMIEAPRGSVLTRLLEDAQKRDQKQKAEEAKGKPRQKSLSREQETQMLQRFQKDIRYRAKRLKEDEARETQMARQKATSSRARNTDVANRVTQRLYEDRDHQRAVYQLQKRADQMFTEEHTFKPNVVHEERQSSPTQSEQAEIMSPPPPLVSLYEDTMRKFGHKYQEQQEFIEDGEEAVAPPEEDPEPEPPLGVPAIRIQRQSKKSPQKSADDSEPLFSDDDTVEFD